MNYFDYETAARKAGIPRERLAEWRDLFEREYHADQMMVELRLLRACHAASESPAALEAVTEALAAERAARIEPRS
jgi:hypothetical protein